MQSLAQALAEIIRRRDVATPYDRVEALFQEVRYQLDAAGELCIAPGPVEVLGHPAQVA